MIRLGAHLGGGEALFATAMEAKRLGFTAVQVFLNTPLNLNMPHIDPPGAINYQNANSDITTVVHGTYLLNWASDKKFKDKFAVGYLTRLMTCAAQIGSKHVVMHCGSNPDKEGAKRILIRRIRQVLQLTPDSGIILNLETDCGGGDRVGGFRFLKAVVQEIDHRRCRICVDTAHMYAAGVDWHNPLNIAKIIRELEWVDVVHINETDPRVKCGKHLDRHNHKIGHGNIGIHVMSALAILLQDKILIVEARDREAVQFNVGMLRSVLEPSQGPRKDKHL